MRLFTKWLEHGVFLWPSNLALVLLIAGRGGLGGLPVVLAGGAHPEHHYEDRASEMTLNPAVMSKKGVDNEPPMQGPIDMRERIPHLGAPIQSDDPG